MRRAAAAIALGLALSACTSQPDGSAPADPGVSPSPGAPTASGATASGPATSGAATSSPATPSTSGSETPTTALLTWHRLPGSPDATVMTDGPHLLDVAPSAASYTLDGTPHTVPPGSRVSDAMLDQRWAIVVAQDKLQLHPERATVTNLRTGSTWTLDKTADLPTFTGGSWSLAGNTAVHATMHHGRFCVASVDLTTHASTLGWCAPPRHGWNAPITGAGGLTILTFDDHHPSCRTLETTASGDPFAQATRCKATSGVVLASGAVWLEVHNEHRYELSTVRAVTPDGVRDLGPADTGSLVVCGRDAYWAVDAQRKNAPAELRRWDGTTLSTVYRSKRGQAFMGAPVCAGSVLTVSSFSTSGDQLVAAHVS